MKAIERQKPSEKIAMVEEDSESRASPETGAALPLIVWSADADAATALCDALEQGRPVERRTSLPDPTEVPAGAKAPEMLLLCRSPINALCRMMQTGTPPSEALEQWMAQAQAVLALNRRNRRRVHVVDLDSALYDPEIGQKRFGLKNGFKVDPRPEPEEVLVLLARQCLAATPSARMLAEELEAVAAESTPANGDPDQAYSAYRTATAALDAAEDLRSKLATARNELEALNREQVRLAEEKAQLEAELERSNVARCKTTELLQAQNHAAQEELEKLEAELGRVAEQSRTEQQHREILQAQVDLMRNELATLQHQRQQSEQRLAQLNQGLESYQALIRSLETERDGLKRRTADKELSLIAAAGTIRDLEARADEMDAALKRLRAERGDMEQLALNRLHETEALQARIRRLETSRSYRLTARLRRMRTLFSGGGRG